MLRSNDGIILEDCLISFMILSTFILFMSAYLTQVYELKQEIIRSQNQISELKECMLKNCALSDGNQTKQRCIYVEVIGEEICVEI